MRATAAPHPPHPPSTRGFALLPTTVGPSNRWYKYPALLPLPPTTGYQIRAVHTGAPSPGAWSTSLARIVLLVVPNFKLECRTVFPL